MAQLSAGARAHISCSTVRKYRCLYSLRCREGVFPKTPKAVGHEKGRSADAPALFTWRYGGIVATLLDFLFKVITFTLFFILGEEIGWRGYLLPKLLSLGRTRAFLLLVGLIWAPWHLVLFFLTPFFPMGNVLIFVPLRVGTIVASFFFGYLRLYTGSLWPASIGHSVHNAAWDSLGALTATSSPVLVNLYLVGDNGILTLVGTALGAIWVGYMLRRGMNKAQPISAAPS